ncbi:glycosyltransferase family 2 protein [Sphingobacterium multivorum]
MPCYNASKYAYEAIVSIIEQSHEDWELIVVDDGSIDDTTSVLNKF